MKKLLFSITLLLIIKIAFTQTHHVKGQVTDTEKKPVPFATVTEEGTLNSSIADANGNYIIAIDSSAQLIFTAVGYQPQIFSGIGNELNVFLLRIEDILQEVIITAQGIKRQPRELGYSAAKLNNKEFTVGHSPQIAQGLSGKVSGLNIYNIDNSIDPQVKIILRGYRSLTGSNDALLVIDGIPYASQISLASLNPNDIESITILKGGQAATLYGSAGVNGALLVNTKKGEKGKLKVIYSNATNIEQISFLPWIQNQYGNGSHYAARFGTPNYKTNYLDRMHDNWRPFENWSYGDAYDGTLRIAGRILEDSSEFIIPYAPVEGENRKRWNTGFTTNNHLSVYGGDDGSTYYFSAEHNITHGIVPGDKSERTGARLAATRQLNQLSLNFTASYTQADYDRTTANFYGDIMNTPAHIPLSKLRDWRGNKFANPNGYFNDFFPNPYFDADLNRQRYRDGNFTGNIEATYKLLSWLHIYNRSGVINNVRTTKFTQAQFFYSDWAKTKAYVPAPWDWANSYNGISRASADIFGSVADVITNDNTLNNEFQIHASKSIGKFFNKLIAGISVIQQRRKQINVGSGSLVQDSVFNVSNRRGELSGGEYNTNFRKYGYYADLITSWSNFIFLHGAYRYEGSSAFFTPTRKAGLFHFPFYGADISFIATDAFPLIRNKILTYAKLKFAYSKNANDNIDPFDPYQLDLTYTNGNGFPFGNTIGYTVGDVLPDPNLKPETVRSYEAGGEFRLFSNRVNVDVTMYKQKSTDQILTVKAPNSTGFPFIKLNVGETKNWGFEADVRVQIIKKPKFRWDVNAYYAYNNNKVLKLYQSVNEFSYVSFSLPNNLMAQTNIILGQSFPQLKATAYVRDSQTGRVAVDSSNGYPVLNRSLVNFGRTTPPNSAGLGTQVRIGNFNLAANAEYRGGNVVFHSIGVAMTRFGIGGWTSERTPHVFPNSTYKDATGKFVPNNNVLVQEAEYSLWADYYQNIAENFVTPAWFIKLRDVSLTYDLPQKWMSKTRIISNAGIGVYGRNLVTIVDKKNYYTDPEFSITNGNGLGINNTLNTPPVRQYGFNVYVTF